MALTTYNELKTSVGDWLNRTDLTTVIPDFIALAEAQIERQLRTRQMIVILRCKQRLLSRTKKPV